jgi:hypothetical protein
MALALLVLMHRVLAFGGYGDVPPTGTLDDPAGDPFQDPSGNDFTY